MNARSTGASDFGIEAQAGGLNILGKVLLLACIYFTAAWMGLLLAKPGTNATAVWLPTGIAIAAVFHWGAKVWPGIFIGSMSVNMWMLHGIGLSAYGSLGAGLAAAAGNSAEAVLAVLLVTRLTGSRNPFGRLADMVYFIFLAALLSTGLSALIGVSSLCLFKGSWEGFWEAALTWWLGDATGALLVTPIVMGLVHAGRKPRPSRMGVEFVLFAAATSALWYLCFFKIPTLAVVLIPWIALVAIRLDTTYSSGIILLLAVLSTMGAVRGVTPFAAKEFNRSLLLQQGFIGCVAVAALLLSSAVWEMTREKQRLQRAYRFEHDLFEHSAMGLALSTPDGRMVDVNPAYASLLGRTVSQTLSLTNWDITPEEYGEDDKIQLAKLEHSGRYGPYEKEYIRKDGTRIPVRLSGMRVQRGGRTLIWSSAEDISDRVGAEEALRQSERKYRELVQNANSIILRWTRDGKITFLNEFGQRFFGYSEEEISGLHVVGTIVPETESTGRDLRPLMDEICADPGKFEHSINQNVCRDGRLAWIAWTNKVVLDEQRQVYEILSIGSDISKQKKAEDELAAYRAHLEDIVRIRTAELAEAKDRAESADRIKSAFLATMSHELRTPLNSIIGFTGILLQGIVGPLNDEQKKQLNMVRDSSLHLLNLINDVLDISKIEAGQLEIASEPFDLPEVIGKVIETVLPQVEKKGLSISADVAPEVTVVTSDRRRVEQILLNLLSNAIKFTDEGGISVACSSDDDRVTIRVTDTGIGIKEEDMDRLFTPFRQIDTGLTRKYEGTGLGLSICKRLATMLGGSMSVKSTLGRGSTFSFAFRAEKGAT